MSAPFNDIEYKTELAMVRHLNQISSRVSGVTMHAGLDNSEYLLPCIVAAAQSATEHIYGSGNYAVDLDIIIASNANDTTPAVHRQRVAYVRDEISNSWVGASMSSHVDDYCVAGVIWEQSTHEEDESTWVTKIPLKVHCRPSD